ncbi:MAG: DnaJ domain-containing protein [Burkholderiales bacterium]|jgi:DnaJ-class molecular chaperone
MSDPYRVLGVSHDAGDESIRDAYLAAIRACPPERDPQRFEQVRKAYEAISTQRDRVAHALFDTSIPPAQEVVSILSAHWQPGRPGLQRLRKILGAK